MAVRVETLLEPISPDDPVGPDLDYTPDRDTIRAAFETGFADESSSDSDVNWREIIGLIESQLQQSKDIWLATYLTRAGALSGNLEVIRTGAEVLAGLVEQYWDQVHPKLDDLGLTGRVNPVGSLSQIREFIGPLRRTILVSHPRLGSYCGADFERFNTNGDDEPDIGMFRAAMHELPKDDLGAAIDTLAAIKAALRRTDAVFMEKADGDGPNLKAAFDVLDQMCRRVGAHAGLAHDDSADGADDTAADGQKPQNGPSPTGAAKYDGGRIETRDEVIRAIESISDYYRRKEPSSPVPALLLRARQWVALDFLTILKDIAPNSLDDARRVLVFSSEEPGD